MHWNRFTPGARLAALPALGLALLSGCGSGSQAPAPGDARQALEKSLNAWKGGETPDALAKGTPPVTPVDSQWQAGQKLEAFEILDEQPDVSGTTKRFGAKLKVARTKGDITTSYVIVGRDPIWVYRQEDYDRLLNMDNGPKPQAGKRK